MKRLQLRYFMLQVFQDGICAVLRIIIRHDDLADALLAGHRANTACYISFFVARGNDSRDLELTVPAHGCSPCRWALRRFQASRSEGITLTTNIIHQSAPAGMRKARRATLVVAVAAASAAAFFVAHRAPRLGGVQVGQAAPISPFHPSLADKRDFTT